MRPGEITLSHRGVLFLDELPEFGQAVLEVLRQPMEDRMVTISRAHGTTTFPSNFMLVAAMNPCPCGFYGDPTKECTCSESTVSRYQKRISGPLLDRIDIFVEVPRVEYEKLAADIAGRAFGDGARPRRGGAKASGGALRRDAADVQRGDDADGGARVLPERGCRSRRRACCDWR